ncbi:MAG: hypothetical protein KA419_12520 [Acidobacteria bacterium]|nr:hypothetical protein [Acidobacteriota bacterium]
MDDRFRYPAYLVRKKILKLFGGEFRVYDPLGNLVFLSKQKAFKLREDIRLYTDESMSREVLAVNARQILDFSAAYDVFDSGTKTKVGALKRRGFKSLVRDEWIVMDPWDREIGRVREDSLALLRRFVNLIPQKFHIEVSGRPVCRIKQNFNPFTLKLHVDFGPDPAFTFDRRLGLAVAVLLCAIEGRQE